MKCSKILGIAALASVSLWAQQAVDDPVLKARAQRAEAQGIGDADLPPVPRGVTEPPPLPPPEIHGKDVRHPKGKAVQSAKASKRSSSKKHRGAVKPAPAPKHPKSKTKKRHR